ncbi:MULTISPECIES: SlyX family protein [Pseudomonas]|uniref:Protein SlyX homolog n=1 Tax=Pseudomonas nitroreducens TaxID=46680 RepID=A0A6G6J1P8_PSENT|nr:MULTISPECIES: SlyX family protein [Pseudomonas]MBG6286906.1 SlyX family protein [Pseudomonas nitroreducens]MCJ1880465.1 SlyX family protein [Pseudomonas nitroreducens]MCJ1897189.1 SlyX family protein [Pseudomonas nitroreducens]MDG9853116.1 SlyX family protein [Pseudomonas nitroreducens]MDH1073114.1 SlyX family protein [Pseudomonas nitroreducens]
MDLEKRMADLESRLAFQDDALQTMSDVVYEQERVIERLRLQMQALLKRLEDLQGQVGVSDDEAPPPHY